MAAPPPSAQPADAASAPSSSFDSSSFGSGLQARAARPWVAWRRQLFAWAAVLAVLAVFGLTHWLAARPQLTGQWGADPAGALVLQGHPAHALDHRRGHAVLGVGLADEAPVPVDALLLHRWPRWQASAELRQRQVAQHEGLSRLLARASGTLLLHFDDGSNAALPVAPPGMAGLGWVYWLLNALALVLVLCAALLLIARPRPINLLFAMMAACQALQLAWVAVAGAGGPGLPAGMAAADFPLRLGLDLCTAAAAVHVFALYPKRLPRAPAYLGAAWITTLAWVAAADTLPSWWLAQAVLLALGLLALFAARQSQRLEPNPYARLMQRLAGAAAAGLVAASAVVAGAAQRPETAPAVTAAVAAAWPMLLATLLLLTPLLARRRHALRELALLAGASSLATALDLLFVAVFALGPSTSVALAVFLGVGVYAGARQWVLNRLVGTRVLTTERAFEHIYRAARAVQAQPGRHLALLAGLLRELFEPLQVQPADRVPARARVVGGGAGLVVPVTDAEPDARGAGQAGMALLLRFAQRGQRLFTPDDARLADRVVDQLRRAVAYDAAVERGRFEERQRIAQDLHDDIGARLLTLMYQAPNREMEDYIRHTLLDLKTLTRGLAASEHRFSHAAAEWKADLSHRLAVAQVTLGWHIDLDRDRVLTVVQWSALTRVLRELVTNAIYHGHATQIDVSLRLRGPLLVLQVADDGEGRAPAQWAHGLGLGGVRKRVKLLGGEVAWRENAGRGIVCEVRLPDFAAPADPDAPGTQAPR